MSRLTPFSITVFALFVVLVALRVLDYTPPVRDRGFDTASEAPH